MSEQNQHSGSGSTPLSEREREILRLVATGATNQQIAAQLDISLNTVKVHMRNIFTKTGASSRTEASLYAVRTGLIEVGSGPSADAGPPVEAGPLTDLLPVAEPLSPGSETAPSPPSPASPSPASPSTVQAPLPARHSSLLWFGGVAVAVVLLVVGAVWVFYGLFVTPAEPNAAPNPMPESPSPVDAEDVTWLAQSPMGVSRTDFGITSYNGQIYVVGGAGTAGVSDAFEHYIPRTDTWETLTPKPTPVTNIQSVVIEGQLYVAGGQLASGAISQQFESYNFLTERWQQLAPLPAPRSQYAAAALNGQVYLFGGWDGQAYSDKTWVYDPSNDSWQELSTMPEPRAGMGVTVMENQIHLLGGQDRDGALQLHYSYDPVRDQAGQDAWAVLSPLPQPIARIAAVTVLSSIYAFDVSNSNLFVYSTESQSWDVFDIALPANSIDLAVVLVNTDLHLFGRVAQEPDTFHIRQRVIYRAQLPLVPR
jgi:DNA-binding CsgD family transcriptional regulator